MKNFKKILLATVAILIASTHLNAGPSKELLITLYKKMKLNPSTMLTKIRKTVDAGDNCDALLCSGIPSIFEEISTEFLPRYVEKLEYTLFDQNNEPKDLSEEALYEGVYDVIHSMLLAIIQAVGQQEQPATPKWGKAY
jgi:hypothetical protein